MSSSIHSVISIERDDQVAGHVIDPARPHRPHRVRVSVDGRPIADVLAADLVDVRTLETPLDAFADEVRRQIRDRPLIPAGFRVQIPSVFRAGEPHEVQVEVGGVEVFRTTSRLLDDTSATIRKHFGDRGQWQITEMEIREGQLALAGWVSPAGGLDDVELTQDGQPVPFELRSANTHDVEQFGFGRLLYAFWPDRTFGMWSATVSAHPDTGTRISFASRTGSTWFAPTTDLAFPPSWSEALDRPAPPLDLIRRTGSLSEAHWRFSGVDFVERLDDLVSRITGRGIGGLRVLDWGCGNGRLSQWLTEQGAELTGVDIDSEGVEWCQANLDGTFATIPLHPPTDLPEAGFDVIIGSSVMTHLAEEDQQAWLAELARLVAPGGLVALTTMGWLGFQNCPAPWIRIAGREIRQRGMSDAHIPGRLAEVVGSASPYYRNTFNPADYVTNRWPGMMDLVTIEEGFNADRQDLVVLRRTQ